MKLVVTKGRAHPRGGMIKGTEAGITWLRVYWKPTKNETVSHLWGLVKGYRGPTHTQFAELVVSFIPSNSIVYGQFLSHLGEVPYIVQDMERLGLKHESPTGEKGFESVIGQVNREFVFMAFQGNSGWESEQWSFLVASQPIEGWVSRLTDLSQGGVIGKMALQESELFLVNQWEHGLDVLSDKMDYVQVEEIAIRLAKSLGWELEIS
jgi:hypothetical protein